MAHLDTPALPELKPWWRCSSRASRHVPHASGLATPKRLIHVATVLAILAPLITLSACGDDVATSSQASFVASDSNGAVLVQWTRSKDASLSGSMTIAQIEATNPLEITPGRRAFTGTIDGSSVSLRFSQGFGAETTILGKLDGSTLSLDIPLTTGTVQTYIFRSAGTKDYNDAVAQLRQRVNARQEQAQRSQDEARLFDNARIAAVAIQDRLSALTDAISGFASDRRDAYARIVSALNTNLAQAQQDLQDAQTESTADAVCAAADSVAVSLDSIEQRVEALQTEQSHTDSHAANIRIAVRTLRESMDAMQTFDARHLPPEAPTLTQVDDAIMQAQTEIRKATAEITAPASQANEILHHARAYAQQADALCAKVA